MKDIETKDDKEFKFDDDDDDDDDSILAAMLPDSVTKPTGNPSNADAFTVLRNPIQRLPRSNDIDPNSSQASQLPLQPQVNIDQSPGQSEHNPEACAGFQDPFMKIKIGTFSLRVLSVYLRFQSLYEDNCSVCWAACGCP